MEIEDMLGIVSSNSLWPFMIWNAETQNGGNYLQDIFPLWEFLLILITNVLEHILCMRHSCLVGFMISEKYLFMWYVRFMALTIHLQHHPYISIVIRHGLLFAYEGSFYVLLNDNFGKF